MKQFFAATLVVALILGAAAMATVAAADKPPVVFDKSQAVGTKATCPVTGESFTITKDTANSQYQGKYVYFCCPACKPQFDADPEKFLKNKK